MRRFAFLAGISLALALPACTGNSEDVKSASVCDRTKSDEQAVIALGTAYKAFRVGAETGVTAGFIKGVLAGKVAEADNKAYSAVLAADTTYRTCNGDLGVAISRANEAIVSAVGTVRGDTNRER